MNMTTRPLAAAMALAFVGGCTTSVSTPAAPTVASEVRTTDKGGIRQQAVAIRATVEKVDVEARKVSLLGFDGTRETLTVSDDVKNLAQVRRGDEVTVTYYQAVAFEVLAKGEKRSPATAAEALATAEPGEMPGGAALQTVTILADVVRLDRSASTATLRGPEGSTRTVQVQNPAVFDKVKAGDKVEIRMTEAMAVDVQRAAKK